MTSIAVTSLSNRGTLNCVSPINRLASLNRGRVGWWKLVPGLTGGARGTRLLNLMKLGDKDGHHGILTNGAAITRDYGRFGGLGGSVFGDGTDDVIDCGTGSALAITGPITVGGWFYLLASPSSQHIFLGKGYDGSKEGFILRTDSVAGHVLQFFTFDGVSTSGVINGRTFGADDASKWHHVAGTWDGATWKTWYNGLVDVSTNGSTGPQATASPFAILGEDISGNFQRCINAACDDVGVWNRALSASEMLYWYNSSRHNSPSELNWMNHQLAIDVPAAPSGTNAGRLIGGSLVL
jgi:hypothetical protein